MFTRYPWYVEMGEPRAEEDRPPMMAQLWLLCHGLADSGRYGCMLVFELGHQLATNEDDEPPLGRVPNTDALTPEAAGIRVDERCGRSWP